MADTKFTPGPWSVVADKALARDGLRDTFSVYRQHDDWREFVSVQPVSALPETAEANAHLIAAAPELYGALEEMVAAHGMRDSEGALYPVQTEEVEVALRALAKARGEKSA